MNELVPVVFDEEKDCPMVDGRVLHDFLEVETPYAKWFNRMCEYGFVEKIDFLTEDKFVHREDGSLMPQKMSVHSLTLDMAKQICMLQRNEKGKQARLYFLQVEKDWNSPEKVMARALVLANRKLGVMEQRLVDEQNRNLVLADNNRKLLAENKNQEAYIKELEPKATYLDTILRNPGLVNVTQIAQDYGMSAAHFNRCLENLGVQFKQRGQWILYSRYKDKGYVHSETVPIVRKNGMADIRMNTKWTQEGRKFLYYLLKKKGIIPCIERKVPDNMQGSMF